MSNPYFECKQFVVYHDQCAMKVGTDGLLLGSWAATNGGSRMLDIGTGSGLIALMLAQRSDACIDALELDPLAARQAADNFNRSQWSDRLRVITADFTQWPSPDYRYDLIISNPPFYMEDIRSHALRRDQARSAHSLSYLQLLSPIARLLSPQGRLAVVIPAQHWVQFEQTAWSQGLYLCRVCRFSHTQGQPHKRVLAEFALERLPIVMQELYHYTSQGEVSESWRCLTAPFYLSL